MAISQQRSRFLEDRACLARQLDETIRFALAQTGIPLVNDVLDEVYGEHSLGRYPEQPEMRFFLNDVAAFTPELLNRIRRLVADDFRSWSVVPQFAECSFTITLSGFNFALGQVHEPVTEQTPGYRDWRQTARWCDEKRYGAIRRQLRWIEPRITTALTQLGTERAVVMGAFDQYPQPYSGKPIWVLHRPEDSGTYRASLGSPASQYPVDAGGRLHARYSARFNGQTGEPPAAWLTTYLFSESDGPELDLVDVTHRLVARVRVPDIITDATLKAEASR